MRKHEPIELPNGLIRCMHCGAAWADEMGVTCINRPGSEPERGRERRISALDDVEALRVRIDELQRERDETMQQNTSSNEGDDVA